MAVVKRAVFLLLLLAVSAYADHHVGHEDKEAHDDPPAGQADPIGDAAQIADAAQIGADQKANPDCENLNKALHSKDLHKSFGDWVLVYGVADQSEALEYLRNLSSSHIELRLLEDNKTVTFKEWNKYKDGSCAGYFMKTSLAENRADHDQHILPINGYHFEKNGAVEWRNNTGEIQFYQSCDNSLQIVFEEEGCKFLLNYVREGHHTNVTQLREHDDRHDRQARCLGYCHEEKFLYEGAAETCSKVIPESLNERLELRGNHGGSDPNGQKQ